MIWDTGFWGYTKHMPRAFDHDQLPLKQQFIELARNFHKGSGDSLENQLASALLYMNVADYLAEYLVIGLAEMSKEAMSKYYLGMVSVIPQQKGSFNIGNAIHALKGYDFPKKTEIMKELEEINSARKLIAHRILKSNSEELPKIDNAYNSLVEHTERLVVLVDDITPGMPPTNIIEKYALQQAESETRTEANEDVKGKRKKR